MTVNLVFEFSQLAVILVWILLKLSPHKSWGLCTFFQHLTHLKCYMLSVLLTILTIIHGKIKKTNISMCPNLCPHSLHLALLSVVCLIPFSFTTFFQGYSLSASSGVSSTKQALQHTTRPTYCQINASRQGDCPTF